MSTPLPTISSAKPIDNSHVSVISTTHSSIDTANGSLSLSEYLIISAVIDTNTNINFASITATESTPNREKAIVFNSIDGIPQKEYILAIGKIVKPINIIFMSRISKR